MFRKLIKKFKKIHLYFRVGIVYLLFLFIKWMVFRFTGIEVGIEGLRPYSSVDEYGKTTSKRMEKSRINKSGRQVNV